MEKKLYKILITKLDFFELKDTDNNKYIIFLYEKDKLIKVQIFNKKDNLVSAIYLAKVKNILKNISAAFLEIENKELVYLDLRKTKASLKEGDEVLVQIEKEALKTKQAVVTDKITIKNIYSLVFLGEGNLSFSSKIKSQRLKEKIQIALDEFFASSKELSDIKNKIDIKVRTSFSDISYLEDLKEEIIKSAHTLLGYKRDSEFIKAPKLMKEGEAVYTTFIADYFNDISELITDDKDIFTDIKANFNESLNLRFYEDAKFSLAKLYSLKTSLAELLNRKVWLKSGAYIIIESTETLNLIDINTGKNINKNQGEDFIYKINLEAAKEAVRQIILRNLSGIIIIDFINMKDDEKKSKLIKFIREEFKSDKARVQVYGFTKLELLEISRQKIFKTLKDTIFDNKGE